MANFKQTSCARDDFCTTIIAKTSNEVCAQLSLSVQTHMKNSSECTDKFLCSLRAFYGCNTFSNYWQWQFIVDRLPSVPAGFAQRLKKQRLASFIPRYNYRSYRTQSTHKFISHLPATRQSFRAEVNVILVPAASQTYEPLIIAGVHRIGPT